MRLNEIRTLAVLSAALLLAACGSRGLKYRQGDPATLSQRMEQFVETVRTAQAEFTEEQWAEAGQTFQAYADEAAEEFSQLSDRDKRRIARAAGLWTRIQTLRAADGVKSFVEDAGQMLPEFLEGFSGSQEP